jgi:hypothetical protein
VRKITADKNGLCHICNKWKPTVEFEEEAVGYEGYRVNFEICQDCFIDKLNETSD